MSGHRIVNTLVTVAFVIFSLNISFTPLLSPDTLPSPGFANIILMAFDKFC
jgi:hypothetical protein